MSKTRFIKLSWNKNGCCNIENENPIDGCCSRSLQIRKQNAQATKCAENVNPTMVVVNST